MGTCTTCGNDYDRTFDVTTADGAHVTFDSIECAAHHVAPRCTHCDCMILGHGVQVDTAVFCCAACARHGVPAGDQARDRVGSGAAR